jgi:hypothetical protein
VGLLDRLKKTASDVKGKAQDLADEHGDKVKDNIDKAGDFVQKKTKHKHDDKVDKGVDLAKGAVDKLAAEDDAGSDDTSA